MEGGIFINTLELISHYHSQLAAHMANVKALLSYFLPQTHNEIMELLGSGIKKEIIKVLKSAKYFSIMFDCTPDKSHKEQMSQVVRFVDISEGSCAIKEHFFFFIHTKEKTGSPTKF